MKDSQVGAVGAVGCISELNESLVLVVISATY